MLFIDIFINEKKEGGKIQVNLSLKKFFFPVLNLETPYISS